MINKLKNVKIKIPIASESKKCKKKVNLCIGSLCGEL